MKIIGTDKSLLRQSVMLWVCYWLMLWFFVPRAIEAWMDTTFHLALPGVIVLRLACFGKSQLAQYFFFGIGLYAIMVLMLTLTPRLQRGLLWSLVGLFCIALCGVVYLWAMLYSQFGSLITGRWPGL
jgi:hypothetical protein